MQNENKQNNEPHTKPNQHCVWWRVNKGPIHISIKLLFSEYIFIFLI